VVPITISPEGRVFTGDYDGNMDVFVVAASGGVPKLASGAGSRSGVGAGRPVDRV